MYAGSCSPRRGHILVSGQGRGQRERNAGTARQRLGAPAVAGGRVTGGSGASGAPDGCARTAPR